MGQSIIGPLRVEGHTPSLVRKVQRGDIVVIDALDLNRATAAALTKRKPAAVLNVQQSLSGRYPAGGAMLLAEAGILLVDSVGAELLAVPDGTIATLTVGRTADAALRRTKETVKARADLVTVVAGAVEATGHILERDEIVEAMDAARAGLPAQLASFTAHAMDSLGALNATILDGEGLPNVGLDLRGQHVLVVAHGFEAAAQVRSLKAYLKDHKPVVIAVGEGLHTIEQLSLKADIVVATADDLGVPALTSDSLRGVKHVVAHSPSGTEFATARVDALPMPHSRSDLPLSSEDLALLMAHHGGAELIVAAGVDATLLDYVESGRVHAPATLLTRIAAAGHLLDARAVSELYRSRLSPVVVVTAVALALSALGAALWLNDSSRAWLEALVGLGSQAS